MRPGFFLVIVISLTSIMPTMAIAATVDVTAYGANGNDTLDDTIAITAAVADLNDNDILLFPEADLYYNVAMDASFTIDQKNNIQILIRGRILAEGAPANGSKIFNITYSDDIEFIGQTGNAIIEGPDQYVFRADVNDGPCLIKFLVSNRCTVRNLTLRNGPAASIRLQGGLSIKITDCLFEGGPMELECCGVHGILFVGVKDLLIKKNRFTPSDSGGKALSWIGSSSNSWS